MSLKRILFCILLFSFTHAYSLTQTELLNTWILVKLQEKDIALDNYSDEKPNITFQEERFAAWAGCNRIAGTYTFNPPDSLEFPPNIMMTKMACMNPQNIEDEFVSILPMVKKVQFTDNHLQFLNDQSVIVAEFIKSQN